MLFVCGIIEGKWVNKQTNGFIFVITCKAWQAPCSLLIYAAQPAVARVHTTTTTTTAEQYIGCILFITHFACNAACLASLAPSFAPSQLGGNVGRLHKLLAAGQCCPHKHTHTHTQTRARIHADNLFSRHLHASWIFHKHLKGFHYNTHIRMRIYLCMYIYLYACICIVYYSISARIFKSFCCYRTYLFVCNGNRHEKGSPI